MLKAYDPVDGVLEYSSKLFKDSDNAKSMLWWLRGRSGLETVGPASDILVWRETGPNAAPAWTPLQLDWSAKCWGDLNIAHGDVLVV